MRTVILSFLSALLFSHIAYGDELLCASKKNETLYYTSGQIRLTAEIANTTLLTQVSLTTTGSRTLGSDADEASGAIKNNYVRFEIGGDAWCSYRLVLPIDFMTRESVPAFLDAYCEENSKYSINLNCSIR